MNMNLAGDLESLLQDTTSALLKFNVEFSKHKEYVEQDAPKFKKWEERLQERERKIEEKENEIDIVQEVSLFTYLLISYL